MTSWMSRGRTPRAPEKIDLENESVERVVLVEDILQRGVGDDPAVPEMVGADLHHGQRRGEGAARHDVLRPDRFVLVVEIREVAGQHVHRAHRKACSLFVEQREIDQLFERLA